MHGDNQQQPFVEVDEESEMHNHEVQSAVAEFNSQFPQGPRDIQVAPFESGDGNEQAASELLRASAELDSLGSVSPLSVRNESWGLISVPQHRVSTPGEIREVIELQTCRRSVVSYP